MTIRDCMVLNDVYISETDIGMYRIVNTSRGPVPIFVDGNSITFTRGQMIEIDKDTLEEIAEKADLVVRAEAMDCVADYDPDTGEGTDNRTALNTFLQYCADNNKIADLGSGKYYCSVSAAYGMEISVDGTLWIKSNGAQIYSPAAMEGTLLKIQGDDLDIDDAGRWHDVTQSIPANVNYLVSPGLAAVATPNDVIKIFSEQPATDLVDYQEIAGRGEYATVRNVVDDVVFLQSGIMHEYPIDDWEDARETPAVMQSANVRVAITNIADVYVEGVLQLINPTTDYAASGNSCNGAYFEFCRGNISGLQVFNFPQRGVRLTGCYDLIYLALVKGAVRNSGQSGDGSPGYGVEVVGCSKNITIYGVAEGARHAVAVNAYQGINWEIRCINMVGYGIRSNPVFDCHGVNGSFDLINCKAVGGTMVRIEDSFDRTAENIAEATTTRPYGFEVGALYSRIENFEAINCNSVGYTRSECHIEKLIIDGLKANNDARFYLNRDFSDTTMKVKDITLNNIHCGIAVTSEHLATGDIYFSNIFGTLSVDGNTICSNPSKPPLDSHGTADPESAVYGVAGAFYRQTTSPAKLWFKTTGTYEVPTNTGWMEVTLEAV